MGIAILSGTLTTSIIDPITRTHYYPNVTVSLSIQSFIPPNLRPAAVTVRCRKGATNAGIVCRVYDCSGAQILVDVPSVNVSSIAFTNFTFTIEGASASFPSAGLWTCELDISFIDLAGIELIYIPTLTQILSSTQATTTCSSTVVIS